MAHYFHSPRAEYRAARISQMLEPHKRVAAMPDGNVIANFDGHLFTFTLEDGSLKQVPDQTADIQVKSEPQVVEITD